MATHPPERPTLPPPRRPLMRNVPAIDGMRAVAVTGVLLFHGGVSWMPGGFLGVDVFFVLSGYLITTLLLRERVATGAIDLRAFWIRRLRRLAPALLVLLAAVGVAAPFLIEGTQRASVRGDGLAALGYVANWRFIVTEQSYFAGTPSPLRHLWSLSVEEQWYLVFPLVVAALVRSVRRIRLVCAGLVAATIASALWMAHLSSGPVELSRAYYGTDARAHSLLVGAVLAVVAAQWPVHRARRLLAGLGTLGAGVVVAAFVLVSEADRWMYRGGFLGLALASAAVVAAVALPHRPGPLATALGWRPLVAVGRISYGLYLWHWPVDVALTPERTGLDGAAAWQQPALLALRTAVAVAAAVASYRWIEEPVRRHGLDGLKLRIPGAARSRPATAAVLAGLVVWILVAGTLRVPQGATATAAGLPPELVTAPRGVPDLPPAPPPTIPHEIRRVVSEQGLPPVPEGRPVRVLVVGDSVAWTLSFGTHVVPPTIDLGTGALIGCGVVDGAPLPGGQVEDQSEQCDLWTEYWQVRASELEPDVVMIQFGAWEVYDHLVDGERVESGTDEMRDLVREGLDRGVSALLAVRPDVRFVVMGTPCMRERSLRLGGPDSERNDPERVAWVNDVMADYAADLGPRATFIDPGELVCPGGRFLEEIDGVELRPDGSHYAAGASTPVWAWLAERIVPFARTPVAPETGADVAAAAGTPGPAR
ncbi:acyltransferase family protein [Iamia sp. SCSIO 61187]|uniref:acyltransferase family protein n=1 Tax=Iamia sp. SCSIO 61187 TaxID=2722752 RepID=UPI001C631A8F|nr:acyltransferase family protein [Iamia sp. SCSIO 61187]QYG93008.1 acyltransferase family protein [Iamia sp. SCSIO 61187]